MVRNIGREQSGHSIIQCPDGRTLLTARKPLADGGWVATMEDITERRNLEQERDRNYAFLSQIIDHIPSQITVKDVHDRRYLLVNRVAEAQFGISRDLIIGKTAYDIFPKAAADIVTADDEKTLQSVDGLFKDEHLWESQAMAVSTSPPNASGSAIRRVRPATSSTSSRACRCTSSRPGRAG